MSLFPIFKVNYLTNKNKIEKILVFLYNNSNNNYSNLFETNPNNIIFNDIFNESEIAFIKNEKIKVEWLNEYIHIDDNIGTIKIKIMKAFSNSFSIDETYLYCLKKEVLNTITIYQTLTLNDKIPLTRIRLNQLLLNLRNEFGQPITFDIPDKERYNYDDILKLDLSNKEIYIAKILGQKIIMGEDEYPFIADPFQVEEYDVLLEKSRQELTTLNNSLLLNTGIISNNNIYLCLANDVLKYCETKDISQENTIKIYFPFLYKKNIDNLENLQTQQQNLITNSMDKITPEIIKGFQNISMFYNIYQEKVPSDFFSLNTFNTGIKFIKVIIHPDYKVKIPIDVIFKLIHANQSIPLIKYNPSSKQENMYRLYANNLTTDGRRIPYLPKTTIYKLIKNIGKSKSVAVYNTISFDNISYSFICEFEENGIISIYPLYEFDKVILIDDHLKKMNDLISLVINPIIDQIKPFFEQSGYKMNSFENIWHSNIEIRDLKLQSVYNISQAVELEKYIGCISSVFTIESSNIKKGIEMRYKRVSNFNKHDSQEAFVIEKQKQGLTIDEIVVELRNNYNELSEEEANDIIFKLINELQVSRGANKRRAIEIKINPGFKTIMLLNTIKSELVIEVDNINDLFYLYTIPIYLDSIVRITQDINSTKYNKNIIKNNCSGKELEEIIFEDIVGNPEQSFMENEIPNIENETISYSNNDYDNEKMDNLLDILGYSDETLEGGAPTSSSSIESENYSETTVSESESPNISIGSNIEGSIEGSIVGSIEGSIEGNIEGNIEEDIKDIEKTPLSISSLAFDKNTNTNDKKNENEELLFIDIGPSFKKIKNETNDINIKPKINLLNDIKLDEDLEEDLEEDIEEQEEKDNLEVDLKQEEQDDNLVEKVTPLPLQNTVKNLEGLRLNNPYIFQEKLEQKDPNIFLTLRQGKFDGYSRMCPSNTKRQPVIVTKEELNEIVKDDKELLQGNYKDGEYEGPDVIKYGSNPDNQYYYMCPRYWCLLTNKPLTEKQVRNGECGGEDAIIPKNVKKVPKGKSIYQFYGEDQKRYPGFHKEHTPQGLCIPCCYDTWNKKAQSGRRAKCKGEKIQEEKEEVDNYIKGPEKFPLGNKRWGYLPLAIQLFFNETNASCQISKTNTNIKPFHTCLLRHGIESNDKQSFIACIASALFYGDNLKIKRYIPDAKYDVPSISVMKQILLDAIDIDRFITYQNGDLLTSFANKDLSVDESIYYNSKLYKKIQNSNEYSLDFFHKTVQAFENFKLFLLNPNIVIDYTYLWDIVCKPNPMIFESGINLVILEILNNDITNNVEFLCPTNHYSNNMYDARKRTLIIIKHDLFYEPIYSYRNEEKRISIVKTFSEHDENLPNSIRFLFQKVIKPIIKEKCRPFPSMPNIYKFKSPPLLDDLIFDLLQKDYEIKQQVLNYQGKVIGLISNNKKNNSGSGFIPCYPSSLTSIKNINSNEYDFIYMSDIKWQTYENTISFLKEYYSYKEPNDEEIERNSKCKDGIDICKVVEDKMIIGFLTKTNQFVQIDPPIPESNIHDNIRKVTNNNYLIGSIKTESNNNVDKKRVEFIKRIELETLFYNAFRNTIRILLNDYINSEKRKVIHDFCNRKDLIYNIQIAKVIELLKDLCNGYIVFYNKHNENELHNDEITACISLSKDKCNDNPVCMLSKDKCSIIIPKNNLISDKDNEEYYYGKMADELIRYNRIKSFIFKPQSYLSFGQVKYNLKEDEIIILQSLLNNEYFENMIPSEINEYAKFNTYDTAEPIISQAFSNELNLKDQSILENRDCFPSKTQKITPKSWNECFPEDYKEIKYFSSKFCGIYLIIDILKQIKLIYKTKDEIKEELIEEYRKYTNNFEKSLIDKISEIFLEEGKEDGEILKLDKINLVDFIVNDQYYFTNFDLWLLLNKYKIPSIFISTFHIPESRFTTNQFVCYSNEIDKEYIFIGVSNDNSNYKLIVNNQGKIEISLDSLINLECKRKIIHSIENIVTIDNYIKVFKKIIKKKKTKAKTNDIDFDIVEDKVTIEKPKKEKEKIEEKEIIEEKEKPKKIKKIKNKPILVLEEDIELEKEPVDKPQVIEVKKKQTRKISNLTNKKTTKKNKE